jgi:hypothetical protein
MPKINQLKPATSLANTDIMIADTSTGSDTRKIAYSDLKTQIQNESKNVFALKGETATDEQVTTAVTNWLDTNVDPVGSAVVVDKTLSIDGAAADAKTTGDGIADLKSALEFQTESKRLEFTKDGYIATNVNVGDVVSTTPTASGTYSYCIAECKPFDLITINGRGGGVPRLWAFCDNDMKLINKSGAGLTANNLSISAPTGSAFVVINTETSMIGPCYVGRLAKTIVPIYKNITDLRQHYANLSEGDVVALCGYNTETDGMGAIYDIVSDNYAHNAPVSLSNGLYAVPRLGITQDNNKPSGDINAFVHIAETYMQSGSSFVYASDADGTSYPTAFSDDFVPGTYYINCSTLSRLIMYGIDYTNSKYGGGSNSHSQGFMAEIGMQPSFSSRKVDAAAQQAMWAAYNGYAYYPNSDFSNVRVGDLVFFSNRAYNDEPYRFKNIDHVAIFLGIDGTRSDGTKRVQFIGNNGDSSDRNIMTFFYTDSFEYLQKAVLCAGISKQPSHHDSVNIISEPYSPHTVTSGQTIYEWSTDIELQSFSYYTLVIETDIVNSVGFTAKVGDTSDTVFLDGYYMRWFYSPSTKSVFRIVTGDLSVLSASQRKLFKLLRGVGASDSLTVNVCKLYHGWV